MRNAAVRQFTGRLRRWIGIENVAVEDVTAHSGRSPRLPDVRIEEIFGVLLVESVNLVVTADGDGIGPKVNRAVCRKAIVRKQTIGGRGFRRAIDVKAGAIGLLNHDQPDELRRSIRGIRSRNLVDVIGGESAAPR